MHVSLLFAWCLVVVVTAAPNISKDASSNDEVFKFHSSMDIDEEWERFKITYGNDY